MDGEQVHPETVDEWRAWLAEHHERGSGVWMVTWRRQTGRDTVAYEAAVEQALCFGWIDGQAKTLDTDRAMQWFAPRRRGSAWSRSNKERVVRLDAAGLIAPAGRAVIETARADGSWSLLDDVEDLVVPPDLAAAFSERPGSREHWDAMPRSPRRETLAWIATARKPETRARRIRETADKAQAGERAR